MPHSADVVGELSRTAQSAWRLVSGPFEVFAQTVGRQGCGEHRPCCLDEAQGERLAELREPSRRRRGVRDEQHSRQRSVENLDVVVKRNATGRHNVRAVLHGAHDDRAAVGVVRPGHAVAQGFDAVHVKTQDSGGSIVTAGNVKPLNACGMKRHRHKRPHNAKKISLRTIGSPHHHPQAGRAADIYLPR